MQKEKFYITTPIYYASGKLHIGHSYTSVAADTISRYKRMKGYDVMFLTGSDEHGQKIQRCAEAENVTPKEYVDNIVEGIKKLCKTMNISNDSFIRTTDKQHVETVQKIFQTLYDKGDIYKSEYEGLYCVPCESFWTESQLEEGKCPDCGREVEMTKEESYFFKMSKYQDRLIKHIEDNPGFIEPKSRQKEMINNFLKPGLEDLCVSRTTFNWGIPVSFDKDHVVYVWLDALSNYISALGYLTDDDSSFKKYWPADIHLVGKEIVRFHTIIWPAILMALDLPLPKQIFGHGWLILDSGKMSKSKGNVVDPELLVDRYGIDSIRYFLLREVPFGSDGLFSNEALVNRINSDLANDLGNLVSRTVAMIDKYMDGIIPDDKETGEFDEELKNLLLETPAKVEEALDSLLFSNALTEIWKAISRTNKYIDETMPWILGKDTSKKDRLAAVLYNLAESIRICSVLISPFMPDTSKIIQTQLGIETDELCTWESAKIWGIYKDGIKVNKGDIIFPRLELQKELEALDEIKKQNQTDNVNKDYEPIEPEISIDDFKKVDLRTATVISAEKIKKADKLLKLTLDLGNETRQVVSGIAKHYSPDTLIGKQVVVVANLKPVKIRGVESYGMILAASFDEDLKLLCLDGKTDNNVRIF
jgi:methionyl-tRNA synthetase